jgi:uncharacterized protein
MPAYSLPNVSTGVWSMSVLQPGTVLTDLDVYKQRCYIVLNTPIGTDPMRPLFGCDYRKHIDKGGAAAGAKIKSEIIDALTIWVPEVKVEKVTYKVGAGTLVFSINLSISGKTVSLPFQAGRLNFFGGISGTTILNAGYKWYANVLSPVLIIDGVTQSVPGTLPWSDVPGMMTWIRSNWAQFGTWGLGLDEVILYMSKSYKMGSLTMTFIS